MNNRLFKCRWIFVSFAFFVATVNARTPAPPECRAAAMQCARTCMTQMAQEDIYVSCRAQCSADLNICKEMPEGARQALTIPEAIPDANNVTKPLTAAQVEKVYESLVAPGDRASRVAVLVPSLELEMQALPSDPLARVRALAVLRAKYRVGSLDTSNELGPTPTRADPVRDIRLRMGDLVRAELAQVKSNPVVRAAYVNGKLPMTTLQLTFDESVEWNLDVKTVALAKLARPFAGGRPLFMERKIDLQQSEHEASGKASGEPSANEMGLALLRSMVVTGGRFLSPYEAERDTFGAISWVRGGMRLVHIEKGRCQKREDDYWCLVRLWTVPFVRGNGVAIVAPNQQLSGIFVRLQQEHEKYQGRDIVHRFTRTSTGWQVPDVQESIWKADQRAYDALQRGADSMNEAICMQRELSDDKWVHLDPSCKK